MRGGVWGELLSGWLRLVARYDVHGDTERLTFSLYHIHCQHGDGAGYSCSCGRRRGSRAAQRPQKAMCPMLLCHVTSGNFSKFEFLQHK